MTGWLMFWLVAVILLAIIEIATTQLVAIWMAVGGVGALVACSFNASVLTQFLIFIAISAALLLLTRPMVKKFLTVKQVRTNADRLIGGIATVTEEIVNDESRGEAKIGGVTWMARSLDGEKIPPDQKVQVERIEGAKLIVSKL
ncbi:MAG TPA: NfeD family protein [Clostridia bacterium]|nr:NfeD family protein [Clostridia bacterium]